MLKIVLDTNMFISGFLFHGMIKVVFDLVLDGKLQLYISPKLKVEVVEKLKDFNINKLLQNEILLFIETRGIFNDPKIKVEVCRDPRDNFVLELIESTQADYLITRDRDLLELPEGSWKRTKIVKPEDFLILLRSLR